MTHKARADHQDADLTLRAYELRREPVLREARTRLLREFSPRSWDDVKAVFQPDHPLNAAVRQVTSYWELVYSLVRHGVVHEELFLENNGEGLLVYAKFAPYLAELRRDYSPRSFQSAEWVATQTATGREIYERMAARVRKAAAAK